MSVTLAWSRGTVRFPVKKLGVITVLDEKINELIQEKAEFDVTYDKFLSVEICGYCPASTECSKCRYNSVSTDGGEKNGTA